MLLDHFPVICSRSVAKIGELPVQGDVSREATLSIVYTHFVRMSIKYVGMNEINHLVLIRAHELHDLSNVVKKKTKALENKVYSTTIGYITKIQKINSISFHSVAFDAHDGSIVFNVHCTISAINPRAGDTLTCKVSRRGSILFSFDGPLNIIVRGINEIEKDVVDLRVVDTMHDMSKNIIKVVADLLVYNDEEKHE